MDLAQQAQLTNQIREKLEDYVGETLHVRANLGRSKIVENKGKLTQIHPRLFIMEIDRKRGRTSRQSYQYVDILTSTVELFHNDEPIFEPFVIDPEPELPPISVDSVPLDMIGEGKALA